MTAPVTTKRFRVQSANPLVDGGWEFVGAPCVYWEQAKQIRATNAESRKSQGKPVPAYRMVVVTETMEVIE